MELSVTTISSVSGLQETVYEVVKATAENVRKFEKHTRRLFNADFESSFRACGGPYHRPVLRSPSPSDDDDEEEAEEGDGAAARGQSEAATLRSAYGAILQLMCATVEAQAELARRLQATALSPMTLKVVADARESRLTALEDCHAYVYGEDAATSTVDPLAKPASAEVLTWMQVASEVERRARAQLSWVKLKKVGEDAVQSASSPPPPQQSQRSPVQASPVVAVAEAPTGRTREAPLPVASAKTASSVSTIPTSVFQHDGSDSDDDDHHQREFRKDWMDATVLLNELVDTLAAEDEVHFDLLSPGVPMVATLPEQAVNDPLCDPATAMGRRNARAQKLLKGILRPTDEEMSAARRKLLAKCPTLRELMSVFGKMDYNIVTYQVRSSSQQIGESGPLLWTAALDICVSEMYTEEQNLWRKWMEERNATEPPESSAQERCTWMELIQSEPCIRGSQAKMRIVSLAAKLLFPREFDVYRGLGRDDAFSPDDSPEWKDVMDRRAGSEAPFGRTVTFQFNRSSFLAQALQQMQQQRPDVGTLTIDIAEGKEQRQRQYNGPSPIDSYTVHINSGDGTVLVRQSSKQYNEVYDRETPAHMAVGDVGSLVSPMQAALVPTVFDALYNVAEKLGVLERYLLLKKSFDRLRLPVSNEPREYVLNYLVLVFGMCRLPTGVMKDMVEMCEQAVAGGWSTTVRVGYPRAPLHNTSDLRYINLEYRVANTKKAARNEALLYTGKTNFTPELLRMVDYGTIQQKGHAEHILMVGTPGVIPMQHTLQAELAKLGALDVDGPLASRAPGGAVIQKLSKPGVTALSRCDRLIANVIQRHFPNCVQEMKVSLTQSYPALIYTLTVFADVMDIFFATLPRTELEFGRYTFPSQDMTHGMPPASPEESGDGAGFVRVVGRSPIQALLTATRVLRERLDGVPENGRTRVKVIRQSPEVSEPADTTTAATSGVEAKRVTTPPKTLHRLLAKPIRGRGDVYVETE
ncbi:hypothetical protein ABB37_04726 [Leptomonas pyrrhocoris]|uniref:Uncharacterized protein n=1 Tax=Leptomonas pyrrhocoris TaxID=157538 RepID=A0A0N0DVL0_LEPPY|nr:hypothetical protein ABB37_04726 [Leptomonas pyrrhocoris]XP_015658953.1 hypothetical protein ABB37_04726 [Leptomonas pyrrhocoris]KPA80513.1 hypothetical protein ABB37_04726 [Leptomonas pyrrhocoris]KPA80514.1 hypothetical protein ABB37_04726 [Leptomonas pyrrhocoris]|eukprot:XP_015658952.1 hypothetical protein ABB37_04726 [Leptomonas pyrrhocoris]